MTDNPTAPAQPVTQNDPNTWWEEPPANEPQPAATPTPPEFFLKAETGTVYKTAEEAAKGVAEKDRMIAEQRAQLERAQRILEAAGVLNPEAQPQHQRSQLLGGLEAAIQNGDMSFDEAMTAFTQAQLQQYLAPMAPLISHANKQRAIDVAGQMYDPNIPSFVRSDSFHKTLESEPELKEAIEVAESDPTFAQKLPGLYRLAYRLAQMAQPASAPARPAPSGTNPPIVQRRGMPATPAKAPSTFQDAWAQLEEKWGNTNLDDMYGVPKRPFEQ